MKITDKKKPVNTMPKGVWEGSRPNQNKDSEKSSPPSADLQGNGYPAKQSR